MERHSLKRLDHHIESRRVALDYRNRADLANSLQFTVRTLSDIENQVRKASPGTYAMLEIKLAWAPGSIDTILTGGAQRACGQAAPPHPSPDVAHRHRRSFPRPHRGTAARTATPHHPASPQTPRDLGRLGRLDSRGDGDSLDSRGGWPEEG
jgi:hypothetical protein